MAHTNNSTINTLNSISLDNTSPSIVNPLDTLKILSWNCNGLRNRLNELKVYLSENEYDVVALCETHYVAGDRLYIPGYSTHRTDRQGRRGGGTALLIKSHLKHNRIPPLPTQHLETTFVKIFLNNSFIVNIGALYSPPSSIHKLTKEDLELLNTVGFPLIAIGDFNAKHTNWDTLCTNSRGITLNKFVNKHNYEVWPPPIATHYGTRGRPDKLDMAIAKGINKPYSLEAIDALSSDHYPIELCIFHSLTRPTEGIKKTNWLEFQSRLSNTGFDIKIPNSIADIETIVSQTTDRISRAVADATRTVPLKKDCLPIDIKSLIRSRNKLRIAFRVSLNPNIKREINRLNRLIKSALKEHFNERWEEMVSNLEPDTGSLWRISKSLKRERRSVSHPLHGPHGLVYGDDEKAEVFADSLELTCHPVETDVDDDIIDEIEDSVELHLNSPQTCSPLKPVTLAELMEVIRSLKKKSAPGEDNLSNTALRHLPKKDVVQLLSIFNSSLELGYFPEPWKKAKVIFIKKPDKDPLFPDNYRPISLLPTIGKLYERLVLTRMRDHIEDNNLIPFVQFGFRFEHSTTLQLLRVINFASQAIDEKKHVVMTLLDVQRAFDTVWHPALINKLITLQFPFKLVQIVSHFLKNRSFRAVCNKSLSSPKILCAGVPQGSVLSPTLFNIFTYDLPDSITQSSGNILVACYADDVAILSRSCNNVLAVEYMQEALEEAEEWYDRNRLKLNTSKTVAIQISRRRQQTARKLIQDQPIPWQKSVKYLGVNIDKRLRFTQHVNSTLQKARRARFSLLPLLRRNSKLNIQNKLLLFRSMILPILLYAAPVWAQTCNTNIKKIQTFQNKMLRMISNMPPFVRNVQIAFDTGQRSVQEAINAIKTKFLDSARAHQNPLIRTIFEDVPPRHGRVRFPTDPS